MKQIITSLAIGLLIGGTIVWTARKNTENDTPPEIGITKTPPENSKRKPPSRTWLKEVDLGRTSETREAIETDDISSLLEQLLNRTGLNGLSREDRKLYEEFLFEWAERDPDAAKIWARQQEGQARELSLMTLSSFYLEDDLDESFQLLGEVGWFELSHQWGKYSPVVKHAAEKALAISEEAYLEVIRKLPRGLTRGSQIASIKHPEGTNFAALLEGLEEISPPRKWKKGEVMWGHPLKLASPMEGWTAKDPEAAWNHLKDVGDSKLHYSISSFAHDLGQANSSSPDWQWVANQLSQMTSDEQIRLLRETLGIAESPLINRLPGGFEDPAEKLRYRTNFLQTIVDHGTLSLISAQTRSIPKEERTEILSDLRRVDEKGQDYLEKLMTVWEIPTGEIESTLAKIKTNE